MDAVRVQITEWVDDDQLGVVRCSLCDAWERTWTFVEKVPVLTAEALRFDSVYPRPGVIACRIVRRWIDAGGRDIVTVDTAEPWGVESECGRTTFDVLPDQMVPEVA